MVDFRKFESAACSMPVMEALKIACQRTGRAVEDVRLADYVSATKLRARLAEEPAAARMVKRFEPHWRVRFAGYEAVIDDGDGPTYVLLPRGPTDDVLVFEDGVVMTCQEAIGGA